MKLNESGLEGAFREFFGKYRGFAARKGFCS